MKRSQKLDKKTTKKKGLTILTTHKRKKPKKQTKGLMIESWSGGSTSHSCFCWSRFWITGVFFNFLSSLFFKEGDGDRFNGSEKKKTSTREQRKIQRKQNQNQNQRKNQSQKRRKIP